MKKYLLLAAAVFMYMSTPSVAFNPGNENAETVFNAPFVYVFEGL